MGGSIDCRKPVSGFQLALLCIAVTAWSTSIAAGDAPRQPLSESGLRDAIRAADARVLLGQFEHPANDVSRALAAMALDRVTWHLDHSSATAQTCATALHDTMPATAFFCAKFAAGNLRLKGDYAGAARADEAAAVTFKTVADADPSFQGFLQDNALYLSMPPITVERSKDASVPIHFDAQRALTMDVSVNGRVLNVGLDTGAATTLTHDTAHRLGVHVVVPDHGKSVGFLGKSSFQSLGLIDSLQLGEVTLRHVPVEIVDEGRDVIGNDVLMQLGRFRVTRDSLQLPMDPQVFAACKDPMTVSTAAFGGGTLLVKDITINGGPRRTLLDTGNSFVLTGNAGALLDARSGTRRKVHVRDLTHADSDVEAIDSQMNLSIVGATRSVDVTVFPAAHLPYDYILGAGSLADATWEVDFDQAHLCITAK